MDRHMTDYLNFLKQAGVAVHIGYTTCKKVHYVTATWIFVSQITVGLIYETKIKTQN
jgi:hypothetical protein